MVGLLLALSARSDAQAVAGTWKGWLVQDGKTDTFSYTFTIEQHEEAVGGVSISTTADGEASARFSLSGVWDGETLKLQELHQIEPEEPKWCRKYAVLGFYRRGGKEVLEGKWTATGCTPGRIFVQRQQGRIITKELPFSRAGKWTGHLNQSDRDYGFYFELDLQEGGSGTSYIVSEGNGGYAKHDLEWDWIETDSLLSLKESGVAEKAQADWPWCIKEGIFKMRRQGDLYTLTGPWTGFIEGFSYTDGPCAPGYLRLEKPVLTKQIEERVNAAEHVYREITDRDVQVQRILNVRQGQIRIAVWDNGIVDGDVLTLFVNGEQILERYKVSKRKYRIPVELKKGDNLVVLHAEDLGNIPPNTVAVSVDDGEQEQVIILSSNLRSSGAVLIRTFHFDGPVD